MADKMRDGIVNRSTTKTPAYAFVVTVDGKRKWFSGYPTRKAAKAARDEMRDRINKGTYIAPTKMTLGEWVTKWLDTPDGVAETTHSNYTRNARLYVLPHPVAAIPLQAVRRSDLMKHWATLAEAGGQNGAALSRATVQAARAVVSKALNAAVDEGLIPTSPATRAKLPKIEAGPLDDDAKAKAWSRDELQGLLTWSRDHGDRWHPLWVTMANTGMRPGEALALRWRDVDLKAGTLTVWRSAWRASGSAEIRYKEPKTKRSRRAIPLSPETVTVLKDWRKAQAVERLAAGPAWLTDPAAGDLVFTWQDGRCVRNDYLSGALDRTVRGAGVRPLPPYSLRHTFATLLLVNRVPVHKVSALLGHANATMTLNVYAHVIPGDEDSDRAAIAEAIGGRV